MFSDIQNIRSASELLKAEAIDSRLGNKKRDDEEHRRSDTNEAVVKNPPEKEEFLVAESKKDESINRFSLDSLIYFLEDFLEENIASYSTQNNEAPDERSRASDISTIKPWLRSKHVNSNAENNPPPGYSLQRKNKIPPRLAANAYAHQALANNVSHPTRHKVKQHGAHRLKSGSAENIGDIYSLISDLRVMKDGGVTHLDLKDDSALLEGISAAVRSNVAPL